MRSCLPGVLTLLGAVMFATAGAESGDAPAPGEAGGNPLATHNRLAGGNRAGPRPSNLTAVGAAAPAAVPGRPATPQGWSSFRNPLIGMEAQVPSEYWVRLRGGLVLTVEKQNDPATMAFMMPMRPRPGATARQIAECFARFIARAEPRMRAQIVAEPTADRALSQFTSVAAGKPTEGRYCTILTAGGTMALVIGVSAPQGQLEREMATLQRIANGFAYLPPRGRWMTYQSPAGGFTMKLPDGWQVQSSDGRTSKDNIDWVALDPHRPLTRAFQWCPRFCSPQLMNDPLHVMRGYQVAQFQSHEQVVAASLGQIAQDVKLLKMSVNQPLTDLFRGMNRQIAQFLAGLNAAQMDIVVYDCLAQAQVEGRPAVVAFVAGIQTMAINGGVMGQLTDLGVTLRGWCAAPEDFINDSPVLEKVCTSMELSAAFLNRVVQGNVAAANKIRQTYDEMNRMDDQIRQNHWDTMDAIAEMNYDTLREYGGYVNESSGRIEQIPPEKVVKNSRGEYVSREEVERGVPLEQATVLRDAYSDDYMRGAYGRIEFTP